MKSSAALSQCMLFHDSQAVLSCLTTSEETLYISTSLYVFYRNNMEELALTSIQALINVVFTGLQTSQDARFYALSSRFNDFSNQGHPLVIQFSVKHEQNIDCGGGYIKLFPSGLNQEDMHGDSVYNIMFGECCSFVIV